MANEIKQAFNNVYEDGPVSKPYEPPKSRIRDEVGSVIQAQVDAAMAAAQAATAGNVAKPTWAALAAASGTRSGQPGTVPKSDAGTHTDPVVGGTVPNQGSYGWSISPAGWQRLGDFQDVSSKADQTDLDARVPKGDQSTTARALIRNDDVALVYLNGAGEVGIPLLDRTTRRAATIDVVPAVQASGAKRPILYSDKGVIAWLDSEGIDFGRISSSLLQKLGRAQKVAMSSGQSLNRVRSKIALMQAAMPAAKLKVLMIGDSWIQGDPIALGLKAELTKTFALADTGFMSIRGTAYAPSLTGATLTTSVGWTITNATDTTTYPYGTGPDGQVIYTTATNQTVSIAGLKATSIKILRNQYGGTWRYRVDGGSYTTVTDPTGGAQTAITISGLADADHTVDIDTTGNAATVALAGIYAERTAVSGIQINRFGTGGIDAYRQSFYRANMALAISLIQPDLVITILGTNDAGGSTSTPAVYAAHLSSLANLVHSYVSDCGMLHIIPPVNAGAVVTPLSAYRDAVVALGNSNGSEYLSLFDTFGTYAQGNALGIWQDTLHLNPIGGRIVGKTANDNFVKL